MQDRLTAEELHKLDRVISASNKMSHLIDDILQLSRITRQELEKQDVNLSWLAEQVLEDMQKHESERQVSWHIDSSLHVMGDPTLLRILLENLIGNAWKYTSKQPAAEIHFGCKVEDGLKIYYIRDNGPGFDMQYADKLFKPFERLHTTQEFEGTGIGLATAKRIISRHHGKIWIDSKTGGGTTVFFQL